MKIDHIETRKDMGDVLAYVRVLADAIKEYNDTTRKIKANRYQSEEGKKAALDRLAGPFKAKCEKWVADARPVLERIQKREMEFAEILDPMDEDLQACVNLIQATNGRINSRAIIDRFIGNHQHLLILKSIFEQKEFDLNEKGISEAEFNNVELMLRHSTGFDEKYLDKYIIDVEKMFDDLIYQSGDVALHPENANAHMIQFCDRFFEGAERLGIEFTEDEKETRLDRGAYLDAQIRAAVGLPAEDI